MTNPAPDIDHIERLYAEAGAEPWVRVITGTIESVSPLGNPTFYMMTERDKKLIAAMREAMPQLCAEVRRLREAILTMHGPVAKCPYVVCAICDAITPETP